MATIYSVIPALVGGTVPDATKYEVDFRKSGASKLRQVAILVTDAGTHNNFVATLEGSFDGTLWSSLSLSLLNDPSFFTLDDKGVAFAKPQALVGVVLLTSVSFSLFRFGLGGDGANGKAVIIPLFEGR